VSEGSDQAPPPPSGEAVRGLRAFLFAVLTGACAAAAPGLLMTVPLGLSMVLREANFGGLLFMFTPLMIALPVVLGASLVIGLPLTALLRAWNREAGEYYVLAGIACGAVPFFVWMLLPDAAPDVGMLVVCGAIGGAATGWRWGQYRDAVQAERE
jgi:hypothetical protein